MSWPSDGNPRFVVVTVTGYLGHAKVAARTLEGITAMVLDRANCHRVMREWRTEDHATRARVREWVIEQAETLAMELNAK